MIKRIFLLALVATMCFMSSVFGVKAMPTEGYYCDTSYFETGANYTYHTEVINFDYYTVTDTHIARLCPVYRNYTQTNSCAPLAGSVVIGYHDATKTNLVPNYAPGYTYEGEYYFYSDSSTMIGVKEQLYDLMGTNTIQPGTSRSQFRTGLTSYVEGKGYDITYTTTAINYSSLKNHFETKEDPVVLFLNSYTYYDGAGMYETDNSLSMYGKSSTTGHVVVAYGYQEHYFYTNNALTRTEKFLVVVFGDGSEGFLSVNSTSGIDEAVAVDVY